MNSSCNPKVTIAIPTFNRASFLHQAVESALAQTYQNIEIIVSDNASTDATKQLLSSYKEKGIVVIEQTQNVGMIQNWNACLERATGEYFLLLSDDDVLEPMAIDKLVAPFLSRADTITIGIVFGRTRIVDEQLYEINKPIGGIPYEAGLDFCMNFLRGLRIVFPCSTLFRVSDLKQIGGYKGEKYFVACDAGALIEIILKRGYVVYLNEITSNYRKHNSNLTNANQIERGIIISRALRDLVLAAIEDKNGQTYRKIQKAGEYHTANVIIGLLYQSSQNNRIPIIGFIRELATYKIYLQNWQGITVLSRTLVKLISPSFYYLLRNLIRGV